jgi:hypothetical protein
MTKGYVSGQSKKPATVTLKSINDKMKNKINVKLLKFQEDGKDRQI